MIGKILSLAIIGAFVAAAIMFDWFGARDWVGMGLDTTEQTVQTLTETGEKLQKTFEDVKEMQK
jgi:hypothetical protein